MGRRKSSKNRETKAADQPAATSKVQTAEPSDAAGAQEAEEGEKCKEQEDAEQMAEEEAICEAEEKENCQAEGTAGAEEGTTSKSEQEAEAEEDAGHKTEAETAHRAEEQARDEAEEEARCEVEEEARCNAQQEARCKAEDEAKCKAEEEASCNAQEEAMCKAEEEARRKAEEEATHKAEEDATQRAEEEARRKADQEARCKAEEEAARRAEEEARSKAEDEARCKAEEEARCKAEEEARCKAEEEARRKAEEEARCKAEEEARCKAEEEARCKAEEEARSKAEEEARCKAEEEARCKAEEEARCKAEEDTRCKAEEEARCKAEEEATRKAEEEATRRAELEARSKAEEEARCKAEEEARSKAEEEVVHRAEEEAQCEADEEAICEAGKDTCRDEEEPTCKVEEEVNHGAEEAQGTAEEPAMHTAEEEARCKVEEEARHRASEGASCEPETDSGSNPVEEVERSDVQDAEVEQDGMIAPSSLSQLDSATDGCVADAELLDVETLPPGVRSFAPAAEHAYSAEALVGNTRSIEKASDSLLLAESSKQSPDPISHISPLSRLQQGRDVVVGRGSAPRRPRPDVEDWFPSGPDGFDDSNAVEEKEEPKSALPQDPEPTMMLFPSNCPDGTVYLSSLEDPAPGWVDDDEEVDQAGEASANATSRTSNKGNLDESAFLDQGSKPASADPDVVEAEAEDPAFRSFAERRSLFGQDQKASSSSAAPDLVQAEAHQQEAQSASAAPELVQVEDDRQEVEDEQQEVTDRSLEDVRSSRVEDLKDLVRHREAELRQMRTDFDARVRRSADLHKQLEQQGSRETLSSLRVKVAETSLAFEARELGACRSMMTGEDFLAQGMRLLHAKDQEIGFLERRVHEVQQKHQRLLHSREPVSDAVAQEALKEKQQQFNTLKADTEAQEEKLTALRSDLRSIIDYMMRINIEAAGGPSRHLTAEEFLPEEVRRQFNFGEHTRALVLDLVAKYEACMEQCQERSTSSRAEPAAAEPSSLSESQDGHGSRTWLQGRFRPPVDDPAHRGIVEADLEALAAARQHTLKPSVVTGLGPSEKPTKSFTQEAKLLRELFAVEMRSVSCALAEDDAGMRGNARMRHILVNRELLRAAAWGDEGTLKELLPVASRSQQKWPQNVEDPAVLGWTPWHAAAAHGQCGALTVLQQHMTNIRVPQETALQQLTGSGLPPLAVACLRGQVEAVKTLLLSQAPVDACGTRGNTALHWAAAASSEGPREVLVQVLLMARADPDMPNGSGQCIDPSDVSAYTSRAASISSQSGTGDQLASGRRSTIPKAGDVAAYQADLEPYVEHVHDPYHIIEAIGVQDSQERNSLLSYTINMLKVPVRDGVGFARNEHAKAQARLSAPESEVGVWSEWVVNYTHAGLQGAVDATQPAGSPTLQVKSRQAIVLTCERLLFFNAAQWSLTLVVPISDVQEVQLSSYSNTLLLLRTARRPEMLLDMAARSRFLDELQVAGLQFSNRWGGEEFSNQTIPITTLPQLIVTLNDEHDESVGVMAFVETNVFLLIPFVPSSLLLSGAKTAFFGFLDVQRSARTNDRRDSPGRWQVHFFVLKEGISAQRKLLWCHHPNDEEPVGQLPISSIRNMDAFESPVSETCLAIEYALASGPSRYGRLMLRASSAQCREDWMSSIKALVAQTRSAVQ